MRRKKMTTDERELIEEFLSFLQGLRRSIRDARVLQDIDAQIKRYEDELAEEEPEISEEEKEDE